MTKELQEEVDQAENDHELILLLKTEVEKLTTEIEKTERHLEDSLSEHHETAEQLALHEKLSAQQTLLKHVFYGVLSLVLGMWSLVFVGWFTGQEAIEREMAFFERIILVFIGIVGGAVSSFFDVRNFALNRDGNGNGNSNGNGHGNGKKRMNDTD